MKTNITRFSDKAADYVKYRPQYPRRVINILEEQIGIASDSVIADIGSGTGISSQLFLENGNRVYAVEPNKEMREAAENQFRDNSNFISIDDSAEKTTLEDNCIDIVFAGQAFHWFDRERAKIELRRILKPDGHIVLAWNERSEQSDLQKAYEQLLKDNIPEYNLKTHKNIKDDEIADFLSPHTVYKESLTHWQMFDLEQLKGRLTSSSYVPNEGIIHDKLMAEINDLFAKYQKDGFVRYGYIANVYLGK